jgi:hypothetical protein
MVGGTPILGFLAILLYGLSAGFVPALPEQETASLNANQEAAALPTLN